MQNEFADTAKYMDDKLFFDRLGDFGFINCMEKLEQTHINNKNPEKPWHLDYFFINKRFKKEVQNANVLNNEKYSKLSDHYPIELIIDI
jgi:exonuclease III